MRVLKEKLLRFAAPKLYERMIEAFSIYHIHPYDVHATVKEKENGLEVSLKLTSDLSQSLKHEFSSEQVNRPNEKVTLFFKEAADQLKSMLIADYYKMMKL